MHASHQAARSTVCILDNPRIKRASSQVCHGSWSSGFLYRPPTAVSQPQLCAFNAPSLIMHEKATPTMPCTLLVIIIIMHACINFSIFRVHVRIVSGDPNAMYSPSKYAKMHLVQSLAMYVYAIDHNSLLLMHNDLVRTLLYVFSLIILLWNMLPMLILHAHLHDRNFYSLNCRPLERCGHHLWCCKILWCSTVSPLKPTVEDF